MIPWDEVASNEATSFPNDVKKYTAINLLDQAKANFAKVRNFTFVFDAVTT